LTIIFRNDESLKFEKNINENKDAGRNKNDLMNQSLSLTGSENTESDFDNILPVMLLVKRILLRGS